MINIKKLFIPHGMYCYTIKRIEINPINNMPVIKVNMCPFYRYKGEEVYCSYCKVKDDIGMYDQVKMCNENLTI